MQIFKSVKNITQDFFNLVMPPTCLSCKAVVYEQGQICAECWPKMNFIGKYKCKKCGLPFEFDLGDKAKCDYCEREKPNFKIARSVCKHEDVARKLIVRLKFQDRTHLAPYIAKLMVGSGNEVLKNADIIAPIPLHYRRKIFRKYNQAALLAQNISKQSSVYYEPFLLKRIRHTKQQTSLSKKQRVKNVAGAFELSSNININGKNIVLIDDVMTTGSTLEACTKPLREAGAKSVSGLMFARVVPERG